MIATLPITVIVHTKNSAATLETCLRSLPSVAELLVVDMDSLDESLAIAHRYQAHTISVEDVGYVEPVRNVAIAAATQPWIFLIDADESLPEAVTDWLPDLLTKKEPAVYAVPRRNIIFGRALEHAGWWPDYQVRLFRQGAVSWPAIIHAQPECLHPPVELPANDIYALIHQNYQRVDQFIERLNRYTSIEAQRAPQSSADESWLTLMTSELFSRLSAREGWQDKEPGLAISLLQAIYPLVTALKRWETNGFPAEPGFEQNLGKQLDQFSHDLAYWRADYQISQTRGVEQLYWQLRRKLQL